MFLYKQYFGVSNNKLNKLFERKNEINWKVYQFAKILVTICMTVCYNEVF